MIKKQNVENDNKPRGLLLFFAIEAKQPRTTTSQDLDSLSSFALEEKKNDDKLRSLSPSSTLEKKTKR